MSQDGQGPPTDEHGAHEEVGSVAEEAAKLLGALSDWAREQGSDLGEGMAGLAGQAARAARDVDEHLATGAAECTYCPICRTVHVLRRTDPEVRAHLRTAATSLLHAAAGLLATPVPEREQRPGMQHIDLDDDLEEWPAETGPGKDGPEHSGPEEDDR